MKPQQHNGPHGAAPGSPRRRRRGSAVQRRVWSVSGVAILLVLLSSCSTVRVKTNPDRVVGAGLESADLLGQIAGAPFSVLSEFSQHSAERLRRARRSEALGHRADAAGDYLNAAVDARRLLVSGSEVRDSEAEKALVEVHNSALARFAEIWAAGGQRESYPLSDGSGELRVGFSPDSDYPLSYFDRIVAAESVRERGIVRKTRRGYGAPFVAIREQRPERAEEMDFYPPRGLHTPVTVTMDSVKRSGGTTEVLFSLRNPLLAETVSVGSRRLPLAADYSASLAMLLEGRTEEIDGLRGFFNAKKRIKHSGVFLTEPYDPDRIPVLLIHGLISVPMIWRDIVPEMISDPEIAKRYQFMVLAYPSSYPVIESAAFLRDELAALRAKYDPEGRDALSRDMVLVGHSMGGMLAHVLVAEMGDHLWNQFSDTPLDEVPVSDDLREELRRRVYFEPDEGVRRVVYFSAPHRGAYVAAKGFAGILAMLAKLPSDVLRFNAEGVAPQADEYFKIPLHRHYTSRESLKPGSVTVTALELAPYKKGVVYHSIIGDRGRGDTPNSSDGLVEYWSAHQEGAASELIVPSDHGSYKDPLAIEELRRILRLHAGI